MALPLHTLHSMWWRTKSWCWTKIVVRHSGSNYHWGEQNQPENHALWGREYTKMFEARTLLNSLLSFSYLKQCQEHSRQSEENMFWMNEGGSCFQRGPLSPWATLQIWFLWISYSIPKFTARLVVFSWAAQIFYPFWKLLSNSYINSEFYCWTVFKVKIPPL